MNVLSGVGQGGGETPSCQCIRYFKNIQGFNKARISNKVELQSIERMLDLNKRLPGARTDQEQTMIKRQIAATDKEIDELVFELYGLTDEERKIVENST